MKLGHNADDLKINIFCLIRKSNQNELLRQVLCMSEICQHGNREKKSLLNNIVRCTFLLGNCKNIRVPCGEMIMHMQFLKSLLAKHIYSLEKVFIFP